MMKKVKKIEPAKKPHLPQANVIGRLLDPIFLIRLLELARQDFNIEFRDFVKENNIQISQLKDKILLDLLEEKLGFVVKSKWIKSVKFTEVNPIYYHDFSKGYCFKPFSCIIKSKATL